MHTTSSLTAHIVWVTKYRYHVLQGDIKVRCRDLLIQICDAEDVRILKGVVSKDHVHMHIEYPPKIALSDLMKLLKRTLIKTDCNKSFRICGKDIGDDTFGQRVTVRGQRAISPKKLSKNTWSIIGTNQTRKMINSSLSRTFSRFQTSAFLVHIGLFFRYPF